MTDNAKGRRAKRLLIRSGLLFSGASDSQGAFVLTQSLIGIGARVVLQLAVLANSIVLARLLGPGGLGQVFLTYRTVGVLAIVADGGLSVSAAAFFGRSNVPAVQLHRLLLRVVPLTSAVTVIGAAALLAWKGGDLLPGVPSEMIAIGLAVVPLVLYSNVGTYMLAGMGLIGRSNLIQLAGALTWVLLDVLLLGLMSFGALAAVVAYALSAVGQAGVTGFYVKRHVQPGGSASPGMAREFLSFGARAYPGVVAGSLWSRIPVFLLNIFHGPSLVGFFAAAQSIVERMTLPAQSVQAALFRSMSTRGREESVARINRYVRYAWIGIGATALVVGLLAGPLVQLLFGPQFAASVPVTRVLLIGAVFMGVSLILDAFFLNQLARPGLLSLLALVDLVLAAAFGFLLIPDGGILGAGTALVLSQVIGTGLYLLLHEQLTPTTWGDVLPRPRDVALLSRRLIHFLRGNPDRPFSNSS